MLRRAPAACLQSKLQKLSIFSGKFRRIPTKTEFEKSLKEKLPLSLLPPGTQPFLTPFQPGHARWAQPYKLSIGEKTYVARTMSEITRHEMPVALIAAMAGLYPEIHFYHRASGILVTDYIQAKPFVYDNAGLAKIGAALKKWSQLPVPTEVTDSECDMFKLYLRLTAQSEQNHIAKQFYAVNEQLKSHNKHLCHGDFHPGNILCDTEIRLIDYEFVKKGDVKLDVATLATKKELSPEHEKVLLQEIYGQVNSTCWEDYLHFKKLAELRLAIINKGQAVLSALSDVTPPRITCEGGRNYFNKMLSQK